MEVGCLKGELGNSKNPNGQASPVAECKTIRYHVEQNSSGAIPSQLLFLLH